MELQFKKFGGERIDDIGQYVQNLLREDPTLHVCIGCDSKQLRSITLYVVAVTIHSQLYRNGAHVVYARIREKKIRDDFQRLWKEAEFLIGVGTKIHHSLEEIGYVRNEMDVRKGILRPATDGYYKLVELHVDFNENSNHLSNRVYSAALPYLRGMGFKTLGKPSGESFAASCAADLMCKA